MKCPIRMRSLRRWGCREGSSRLRGDKQRANPLFLLCIFPALWVKTSIVPLPHNSEL